MGLMEGTPESAGPAKLARARLTGVGRVWLLVACMATVGLALIVTVGRHVAPLGAPVDVPWWALALMFYVAEANVVRVHFRRDAQSFSLSEIPIVLGLFFSTPSALVVGLLVGSSAALAFHRKQSRLKLAFNIAHFFLGVVLATVIFNRLVLTDPLGPEGWAGALLSTIVAVLIGHAAITAAVVLSGGQPEVEKLPQVLALGMAATATNATLGLIAVTMLWHDPRTTVLLAVPALTLFFAYRAYMNERDKHETIEFIYESTRTLHRSPEVDSAVLGLLSQARQMFRAERAEITLFPVSDTDKAVRTSLGPGDAMEAMARVELLTDEWEWAAASRDDQAIFYPARDGAPGLVMSLQERGIRDAMVKIVRSETRVVGTILVANRLGDLTHFDDADLMLFETLAHNVGLVLENGRLEQSLNQLRELEDQLKHQAYHDPLTTLANRTLFLERVDQALEDRADERRRLAVLFIDLDDFKTINDSLGHAAGDQLLITVAQRVRAALPNEAIAARLGGDEFAVLLQGHDVDEVNEVATRLIEAVRNPMVVHGQEAQIHASVGIAMGDSGEVADELLRNADVAMYTAKSEGKGGCRVFHSEMHVAVIERHELIADLQRALDRDEFVFHYQPIVDLVSGRVVAFEALVRWHHPRRGMVRPDLFISLAEETGLIVPIGRTLLRKACDQSKAWREQFPAYSDLSITVNLSARQLAQPSFVGELMQIIAESGVDPEGIVLEITESVLMHDTEAVITKMSQLRKLGLRLAMDDFGTGFSSLSYLSRLPLDTLKVPKPFVDNVAKGEREAAFAETIVRLGHACQLRLVAEGIEDVAQLEELRRLGCHLGQGYLFGRPLDGATTEALLAAGMAAVAQSPGDGTARVIAFPA
jgi:diguanylate cyclase (GGDEF)-like protein